MQPASDVPCQPAGREVCPAQWISTHLECALLHQDNSTSKQSTHNNGKNNTNLVAVQKLFMQKKELQIICI